MEKIVNSSFLRLEEIPLDTFTDTIMFNVFGKPESLICKVFQQHLPVFVNNKAHERFVRNVIKDIYHSNIRKTYGLMGDSNVTKVYDDSNKFMFELVCGFKDRLMMNHFIMSIFYQMVSDGDNLNNYVIIAGEPVKCEIEYNYITIKFDGMVTSDVELELIKNAQQIMASNAYKKEYAHDMATIYKGWELKMKGCFVIEMTQNIISSDTIKSDPREYKLSYDVIC